MSGQSAKRQQTSAMASASGPASLSLPSDLLETIFGFLDLQTLCTARLVCAQFRMVASSRIRSVELPVETLRRRPETHLNNFPNLGRVSVFDAKEGDLLMLAQSPIAAAVTHVRAVEFLRPVPRSALRQAMSPVPALGQVTSPVPALGEATSPVPALGQASSQHAPTAAGSPVLPLPNLMSLSVRCATGGPAFPFPHTLRELALDCPVSVQTWDLVPGLSNLTCLRIDARNFSHERLEAVTALTRLQRLDIDSSFLVAPFLVAPFLAELTLLTHLQFQGTWGGSEVPDYNPLASLSRLHRLVHLGMTIIPYRSCRKVQFRAALDRQALRSIDTLMSVGAFETACMTHFSQLTALRLDCFGEYYSASVLPRFNTERLRDLTLSKGVKLDSRGVAALGWATGLTHLSLWTYTTGLAVRREVWKTALSSLSRLRALFLGAAGPLKGQISLETFGPLTKLTRLTLSGPGVTSNADVQACLGLKKLRVLSMCVPPPIHPLLPSPITFTTLFALAKLRWLRELNVTESAGILGGNSVHDAQARVNAKRHQKGWPPLELNVSS